MAKPKLCYRTVSSDNYEPQQCIGVQCSMWGNVGGLSGCLSALALTFQCISFMEAQQKKTETPVKTEDVDEGKTDSRACNILEGGTDTPVQHDSNGSSSPV